MKWTFNEVRRAFGGRLIGNLYMKRMVAGTLLLLPDEAIKSIVAGVWFISSPEDAWGFTFRGSDVKNQHLIILSEELFEQEEAQIKYTILHKIGHVMLRHKNSMGYEQTEREIKQQEIEADQFAKKYLKKR